MSEIKCACTSCTHHADGDKCLIAEVSLDDCGECTVFQAKHICGECAKLGTAECQWEKACCYQPKPDEDYCGDEHFVMLPCSECLYYNDRSNCALIDEWYDAEGAERGRNLTYARCFRSRRIEKGDGTE